MKKKLLSLGIIAVIFCFFTISNVSALEIDYYQQGSILPNDTDYDWWYGCSPTSAGMIMGYYDANGYGGLTYDNILPGAVAELNTFGAGPYNVNGIIASQEHINDFYGGAGNSGLNNFGVSGDDLPPPHHSFNSLADFMGTSQDSVGNANGWTSFYFYTNGAKLDALTMSMQSPTIFNKDGMYGIWEFFNYTGYGSGTPDSTIYTQLTDNDGLGYGFNGGFTFDDYMNEIDSGRVVMLHVEGHSMFGYGYDPNGTVYLHDTWSAGQKSMTWGGAYSNRTLWGVTAFTPTGGDNPIPEPATLLLFSFGLIGIKRRFRS